MKRSVHLIIGTKAQFIKMAPIAVLLERSHIPYRVIDLSQHGALTKQIIDDFGLVPDIRYFQPTGKSVDSYQDALAWVARCVGRMRTSRARLQRELVLDELPSVALVHGDTLSTLLGAQLARRLQLRLGLVEAGLTSGKAFSPFPEELIRRHVERRADYLFAAGEAAFRRLTKRRLRGTPVDIGYNTGRDAFALMLDKLDVNAKCGRRPYTVLTLHRAETLARAKSLGTILRHVCKLADRLPPIRFYVHEPTLRALNRTGWRKVVESHPRITMHSLSRYSDFVRELAFSDCILTDGGSIQEEASYLKKPCLVLRRETERSHGIGATAQLTSLDPQTDIRFLRSLARVPLTRQAPPTLAASRAVLSVLGLSLEASAQDSSRV